MIDLNLIAEGKKLLEAATDGPWEVVEEIDGTRAGRKTVIKAGDTGFCKRIVTVDQTRMHHEPAEPNIELIAWAVNNLSLLLEQLEGAHITLGRLQQAVQQDYAAIAAKQQRDAARIAELEAQLGHA
ncbi:hypothetical protein [Nocardia flavorosea]|uniref:Uncharacterized protein n=1 Tax=Nocardia flavorosea TaxID=53429 RepID=A0A846YRU2_9NOCA|nr:hypothetical protein [Nocardia flavorosea]NKY60391.1 hypothetical protein [Nocardia flavorosea]